MVVVGGTDVVSAQALESDGWLASAGVDVVDRVAGENRYATSVAVAEAIADCDTVQVDPDTVALVSGTAPADGIVAGPWFGIGMGGVGVTPILLVRPDGVPPEVEKYLARIAPAASKDGPAREIVAVGGAAVLADAVVDAARAVVAVELEVLSNESSGPFADTTAPLVTVSDVEAGGHSFTVAVAAADLAEEEQVEIGEITVAPAGGGAVELASPSAVVSDGAGGGTVCLFGVVDAAADPQECVSADPNGATAPNVLAEFDEVVVVAGAVADVAGNRSRASAAARVPDITPPVVTVSGAEAGGHSFTVTVTDDEPSASAQVEVGEITVNEVAATANGRASVPLAAPSAVIPDGAGGATVCLFGVADPAADPQVCVRDDPNGAAAPNLLVELDEVVVAADAVVDAAGNTSAVAGAAAGPDATPPVVVVSDARPGNHSFTVTVVEALPAGGEQVAVGDITVAPADGTAVELAAPSAVIPDGAGGGTVCLFGIVDAAADPQVCVSTDTDAAAAPNVLVELSEIEITAGAVADVAGNRSLAARTVVSTDTTPPVLTVVGAEVGQAGFYVRIDEENPDAAQQLEIGDISVAGQTLTAPAEVEPNPEGGWIVCLLGAVSYSPILRQCENGADTSNALDDHDVIVVRAGAVTDAAGNGNEEVRAVPGPDVTPPAVYFAATERDVYVRLFTYEEFPASGQQIDIDEITVVGRTSPELMGVVPGYNDDEWKLCLLGIDDRQARNGDGGCIRKDTNGEAEPNALATGDEIIVAAGAVVDAAGNGNPEIRVATVADTMRPYVRVEAEAGSHYFRASASSDAAESSQPDIGDFTVAGETLAKPAAVVADAYTGGVWYVCLFGGVDDRQARNGFSGPCIDTDPNDADTVPNVLTLDDRIVVAAGAVTDRSGNQNLEAAAVTGPRFQPIVRVRSPEAGADRFSVSVTIDVVGGRRPLVSGQEISLDEITINGVELSAPAAVIPNATGVWRVCLLGALNAYQCTSQSSNGASSADVLADGDLIVVKAGAVTDGPNNPNREYRYIVGAEEQPDNDPPVAFVASAPIGTGVLHVSVREQKLAPGQQIDIDEISISGVPLDIATSFVFPTSGSSTQVCLFASAPGVPLEDRVCYAADQNGDKVPNVLAPGDVITVAAGAVEDAAGHVNARTQVVLGHNVQLPYVWFYGTTSGENRFYVLTIEPDLAPGQQLGIDEISVAGVPLAAATSALISDGEGGGWVCLFGLVDPGADRLECAVDDPNGAASPNVLAAGEVVVVTADALVDGSGNGNSRSQVSVDAARAQARSDATFFQTRTSPRLFWFWR
ncbi:MAG TPA: hypothetical protein DEP66_02300 [Acidimicrobiaceae bacterium]|nr:hypothetical protein [Acidimicrobiaceae bacterium]